ncbi:hydrogenase maturation protein HypF [Halovenus aranensis]|uniref:Carbamoyltransferase n=1 Tax=Halovenus aranensis TaxID=890420 RepID=A0A1G8VFT4_9EURY|nr:carbamoyltransferase HypF [Halovenus aranensis]SDJ64185.1 hydrogenase maturation protein HypF [Halovenus aranensis]
MSERVRASVRVDGVVQGVGFRPFVYRTATAAGVGGYVRNAGGYIDAAFEGDRDAVEDVIETIRSEAPPLSRVRAVDVSWERPAGVEAFEIRDSGADEAGDGGVSVPPDTGICERCLADVRDPTSRYHGYWATSCVDCGPRYTVVRDVPYDRASTSMDEFQMCPDCRDSYETPSDRRYHAQTVACPACGPELRYETDGGVDTDTPLDSATQALADGEILAVKGTGGTHLVCDATAVATVQRLRQRTGRPTKPFALMVPDVSAVESFAAVGEGERETLTDLRRPITLLEAEGDMPWLAAVAPGLHTVGVMLPYAGLHHLLFDRVEGPLVMTSANRPGEPMVTAATALWETLGEVIDGALLHDREIVARCDDSVVRVVDGAPHFLRRSRGWTPARLPNPPGDDTSPAVLAVGGSRDVTIALADGGGVVLSQHIGGVDGPAGTAFHRETIDRLTDLAGISPALVACDRHPEYITTAEARRHARDGLVGPVQVDHHHAHAAALCGEHEIERAVIVTADGTGYGRDGTIWGGEVLDTRYETADRVGGLAPFSLPGGEKAVRHPARILAGLLDDDDAVDDRLVETGAVETAAEAAVVRRQAETGTNAPATTSAGRYLDAISALLGVCSRRDYQGEPALRLEAHASEGAVRDIELPFTTDDGRRVLDTATLVSRLAALRKRESTADVAATAQDALARGLGTIAADYARDNGITAVGFTGGVAYNEAIYAVLRQTVSDAGIAFVGPERVPPGDGGIAYGQALVATARDAS